MKHKNVIIFSLFALFLNNNLVAQTNTQLYFNVFGYIQKVDDRLVGITERDINHYREKNEDMHSDLTRHIGIGLGTKFILSKHLSINSDVNYSYERNNYIRNFNWHELEPPNSMHLSIPRWMDLYIYHLFGNNTAIDYELPFSYNITLGINFSTFIRFKSVYHEAILTHETKSWNKKDFFSFELSPFLGYQYKMLELDIYYRLFNYKKIDRAVFKKGNTGYGAIKNDYETLNLMKLGISIKYWFNLHKQKEKDGSKGKF